MIKIRQGEIPTCMKDIQDNTYHGILSDPPYGLGFMNKYWDSQVPPIAHWREIYRILRPGAYGLIFGGTRTWHRLGCALEDSGFEIRDTIMWLYGQGFPKSLNVGGGCGTALKPSWEPILLVRKPLDGTVINNMLAWGCGALSIDACRIGTETITINTFDDGAKPFGDGAGHEYTSRKSVGRWPANLILDDTFEQDWTRYFYCAKVGTKERNLGLGDLPILSGGKATDRVDETDGLNSPRAGAGRGGGSRNSHPTLKPIALIEHMARLILPATNGNLFIPYAGTGSEIIGAKKAGWFDIFAIEMNQEYVDIAKKRIHAWLG